MIPVKPKAKVDGTLKLFAEVIGFSNPQAQNYLDVLMDAVDEYGFVEVNHHLFDCTRFLAYADFPKIRQAAHEASLSAYRSQLQRLKKRGLKITLSCSEPRFPEKFFEAYPEARDVHTGLFWKFLEKKTVELYRQIPEMDCFEVHLWEGRVVTDENCFGELKWAHYFPYYSPGDLLKETLEAYARAAKTAGKEFALMSFSHYPWEEDLMVEALNLMDRNLPITLDHLAQPGDWNPFLLANNKIMEEVRGHRATLYFDGAGEYWGQSYMPYCYPLQIQQHLQYALEVNPDIECVGMRVDWHHGMIFGNFNEINFYALSRLVKDPYVSMEEVWQSWAERRFGAKAAPKVIRALKRSNEIANLTFYVRGAWAACHSSFSGFGYLLSRMVDSAKRQVRWKPGDCRTAYWMDELVNRPSEGTIEWVKEDRAEALRLNALSLEDIEAARVDLPKAEYEKLVQQFTLQRHFIEACIPQMDALLRYRIEEISPSAENRKKLEQALAALEQKAVEVERIYEEKVPALSAKLIRDYIEGARQMLGELDRGESYHKYKD